MIWKLTKQEFWKIKSSIDGIAFWRETEDGMIEIKCETNVKYFDEVLQILNNR